MSKFFIFAIGVLLILHGIYSIYTSLKGGPLRGVMPPSDKYIIEKIIGQKNSNSFFNLIWGIAEIAIGIVAVLGKFS